MARLVTLMNLDPEISSQLRRVGGDELVGQLYRTFVELAPQRLAALRVGLQTGDAQATRKAVHSIRSSAATLGATLLAEEAGRLERLAQEAPLVEVGAALPQLEAALGAALREMEQRLAELTPGAEP